MGLARKIMVLSQLEPKLCRISCFHQKSKIDWPHLLKLNEKNSEIWNIVTQDIYLASARGLIVLAIKL